MNFDDYSTDQNAVKSVSHAPVHGHQTGSVPKRPLVNLASPVLPVSLKKGSSRREIVKTHVRGLFTLDELKDSLSKSKHTTSFTRQVRDTYMTYMLYCFGTYYASD